MIPLPAFLLLYQFFIEMANAIQIYIWCIEKLSSAAWILHSVIYATFMVPFLTEVTGCSNAIDPPCQGLSLLVYLDLSMFLITVLSRY